MEQPTNAQLGIDNDHEFYCDMMDAIDNAQNALADYLERHNIHSVNFSVSQLSALLFTVQYLKSLV